MGRLSYVCSECSEHFTRKTSGKRHNLNLHYGRAEIVPLIEYLAGRSSGRYLPSHPSWFKRYPQRWQMANKTTIEGVVTDSTQGIVKPRYDSNVKDSYLVRESKASTTYSGHNYALEDNSSRQQSPSSFTVSDDYLTLQKKFSFNLLFPDFLPPNTMRDLLELEGLLFKIADYQTVNPALILQNAIDQCRKGDNRFLSDKLNQLRCANRPKYFSDRIIY